MGSLRNDPYFVWLTSKVVTRARTSQSYWSLLEFMHNYEFVWQLVGDDNRAEDGRALRDDFLYETGAPDIEPFLSEPTSVLEMLVAFAARTEWQTDISQADWFWRFINTLDLGDSKDDSFDPDKAEEILYNFVWRTYEYNGKGGLFPLQDPRHDQREVEIWYQFSEYLAEHYEIGY